jgi:phage gp29-like protein
VNGDVAFREGLARVLAWMAIFRNWDLRDWLSLAEIGWKPWRLGKYGKDATTEDKNALNQIMRAMTASGVAIFNKDTTEIDVEWPKGLPSGSVSTHKELADYLGAEMSKAVLTGTLTVEAGSKGARSLGETHQEGLDEQIEADALDISDDLTRQLAGPFTRMNYGDKYAVPMVLLPCEDEFDEQQYALTVKTLSDAGLRMPASFVREQVGIPEPDEDDEIIGEAKSAEPGTAPGTDPAADPELEPAKPGKRVRRRSAWRARSRLRR